MMHDFAMSAEHIVFMDLPVVFRLEIARNGSGELPYRWSDDYGARLGVLRRDDPYGPIRWFEIDPCYVFHVLNAFDKTTSDGKLIVLQVARYPELWRDKGAPGFDAVMWSWTINLTRGTVTEQQIDERAIEFPRMDDRRAGMPARDGLTVGTGKLVRYDLEHGTAEDHSFGTATAPGGPAEAVFAPADSDGNSPDGICPTSTTQSGTAATWSSSKRPTFKASPLLESNFHGACRTDSMVTGSPVENSNKR
jgi:carotenoid cleavage dioxygenase-like enzyme